MYSDGEYLELAARIGVTKTVYQILKAEKIRLKKEENRRVSMAKLACNAIIEKYAETKI